MTGELLEDYELLSEDELDEKVKNMSTDQIQREIEALKKRL